MAVTLKARAGSSLKARLRYWQPGRVELVDTTGYTARLQVRVAGERGRVLLNTTEFTGDPAEAPSAASLTRLAPGDWRLFLGRTMTRVLPERSIFEIELVNDLNDEDVVTIISGIIAVVPEAVKNAIE